VQNWYGKSLETIAEPPSFDDPSSFSGARARLARAHV
jgi:hypothetical protein